MLWAIKCTLPAGTQTSNDVVAMSANRRVDVDTTLFRRKVPAGNLFQACILILFIVFHLIHN